MKGINKMNKMNNKQLKELVTSCIKKRRYPNEQVALETINRIHKNRKTDLRVYFCKHCLGYHLTHKGVKKCLIKKSMLRNGRWNTRNNKKNITTNIT